MGYLIIFVVLILFAIFWVKQFVFLMVLDEKSLPAQYDKAIWAAAFIFIPPVAPFAFMFFKYAYLSVVNQEKNNQN